MPGVLTVLRRNKKVAWIAVLICFGALLSAGYSSVVWFILIEVIAFTGYRAFRRIAREPSLDSATKMIARMASLWCGIFFVLWTIPALITLVVQIGALVGVGPQPLLTAYVVMCAVLLPRLTHRWLFRPGWRDRGKKLLRYGLAFSKWRVLTREGVEYPVFYSEFAEPISLTHMQQYRTKQRVAWGIIVLASLAAGCVFLLTRMTLVDLSSGDLLDVFMSLSLLSIGGMFISRLCVLLYDAYSLTWSQQGASFYSPFEEELTDQLLL